MHRTTAAEKREDHGKKQPDRYGRGKEVATGCLHGVTGVLGFVVLVDAMHAGLAADIL